MNKVDTSLKSLFTTDLIITAVTILVLDALYIYCTYNIFNTQLVQVQKSPLKLNYLGAVLSYTFIILGVQYFIINPNTSVINAFLLGILIYGVYDTTNLATISNWSYKFAAMDTLWGGTLFALTASIVKVIKQI
jgi:uncharacterized membrane protein